MWHKFLVLLIKAIGVVTCLAYVFALSMAVWVGYHLYIKPVVAKSDLQIQLNHQRSLLELKQQYGELVHDNISK